MYQPSPLAAYWVGNYHGSIDSTALLLAFDAGIAAARRGEREMASSIRDAIDRWEVDGDDERLVNEVIDPWINRTLASTERLDAQP
jgi:hypothetical protein